MTKVFRSRGIRIKKGNIQDSEPKTYYEPDTRHLMKFEELNKLVKTGVLTYFEYSEKINGQLDSLNFHNNFFVSNNILYEKLSSEQKNILNNISDVFGEQFRNFTTGYRINENKICGISYYYYPTVWKETRFGIQGVTEENVINKMMLKFMDSYGIVQVDCRNEILFWSRLLYKFKGISVSFDNAENVEYKLYGKIMPNKINLLSEYIPKLYSSEIDFNEVALTSLRIKNGTVTGYNLYYLS